MPTPLSFAAGHSSYERVPTEYSGDDNPITPLLSSTVTKGGFDDEANFSSVKWPQSRTRRHQRLIVVFITILSVFVVVAVVVRYELEKAGDAFSAPTSTSIVTAIDSELLPDNRPQDNSPAYESSDEPAALPDVQAIADAEDPVTAARLSVDALYARQSSNIDHAAARYSLKTGRPPPRNYDRWFKFAQEKSCLIDDYDQIHRDFAPFYQLAQDDPLFFQRMIDIASKMVSVFFSI